MVSTARAAERATATLRIEIRVREAVRPPHPPRKHDDSDVTFSLIPETKLVATVVEEKVSVPAGASQSAKEKNAIVRTTTYTIE